MTPTRMRITTTITITPMIPMPPDLMEASCLEHDPLRLTTMRVVHGFDGRVRSAAPPG
jgi:hypothetical protein